MVRQTVTVSPTTGAGGEITSARVVHGDCHDLVLQGQAAEIILPLDGAKIRENGDHRAMPQEASGIAQRPLDVGALPLGLESQQVADHPQGVVPSLRGADYVVD